MASLIIPYCAIGYRSCPFCGDRRSKLRKEDLLAIPADSGADIRVDVSDVQVFKIDYGPICLVLSQSMKMGELEVVNLPFTRSIDMGGLSGYISLPPRGFRCLANLRNIVFPSGLDTIGVGCFEWCGLAKADLSDTSLHRVGRRAFGFCLGLNTVRLPPSVQALEAGCFEYAGIPPGREAYCLKETVFPRCKCVRTMCGIAQGQSSAERLSVLDLSQTQVTRLSDRAFRFCMALREVSFPRTLEGIGGECFQGTSLTSVRLEHCGHLHLVGDRAFATKTLVEVSLPLGLAKVGLCPFSRFSPMGRMGGAVR
jgi:hypothetical protein